MTVNDLDSPAAHDTPSTGIVTARQRRRGETRLSNRHVPLLLLGVAVPSLALLMDVPGDGRVVCFRFLPDVPLPDVCMMQRAFGVDCPGCGLTRSIICLTQGRIADSLAMHRLGWLVLALLILQVPYRLWCLLRTTPRFVHRPWFGYALWGGLAVLFVLNRTWDWLIRLSSV